MDLVDRLYQKIIEDPLSPKVLIVPSYSQGHQMLERICERFGSIFNVEVQTLIVFIQKDVSSQKKGLAKGESGEFSRRPSFQRQEKQMQDRKGSLERKRLLRFVGRRNSSKLGGLQTIRLHFSWARKVVQQYTESP